MTKDNFLITIEYEDHLMERKIQRFFLEIFLKAEGGLPGGAKLFLPPFNEIEHQLLLSA